MRTQSSLAASKVDFEFYNIFPCLLFWRKADEETRFKEFFLKYINMNRETVVAGSYFVETNSLPRLTPVDVK